MSYCAVVVFCVRAVAKTTFPFFRSLGCVEILSMVAKIMSMILSERWLWCFHVPTEIMFFAESWTYVFFFSCQTNFHIMHVTTLNASRLSQKPCSYVDLFRFIRILSRSQSPRNVSHEWIPLWLKLIVVIVVVRLKNQIRYFEDQNQSSMSQALKQPVHRNRNSSVEGTSCVKKNINAARK